MFYLIISILGGTLNPLIIRLSNTKVTSKYGMYFSNYVMCLSLALISAKEFKPFAYGTDMLPVFIIGAISGIFYLLGLLYYDKCIQKTGLVITSIFKNTSMIIPVIIAIIIFKHELRINQFIGIVLALFAIMLMNYQKGCFSKIDYLGLLILNAFVGGLGEAFKNVFNEICNVSLLNYYIIFLFLFALIAASIVIIKNKYTIGKYEILFGFSFAIPNFFNTQMLTLALTSLNPVIVFPLYYMLIMFLTTFVGVVFFKEKIDLKKISALMIIVTSAIILNI